MNNSLPADLNWFKSSASNSQGDCLEVAFLPDGRVALRDTEDPENPPFIVRASVWQAFTTGAARGEFAIPGI
ncbi:DUF397 domain-containing protein [Streptomyces sp. DW26H14]|uniref:DUF397 domain-containing protein n=1 Tax=Streptomyces sp. DW26H14 TaxID=3435395 RepID=UPI00403D6EA7